MCEEKEQEVDCFKKEKMTLMVKVSRLCQKVLAL